MFVKVLPRKSIAADATSRAAPDQFALFQPKVRHPIGGRIRPGRGSTRKAIREAIAQYDSEDALINAALELLRCQMASSGAALTSPRAVRTYLQLNLIALEYEVFWCVFLDTRNRVLAAREMFRGTLTETSVYPREVVKAALQVNAAAVIFAHNHPSGVAEPSRADEMLTSTLKQALSLIDVKALDHFVIGKDDAVSFVERGLL